MMRRPNAESALAAGRHELPQWVVSCRERQAEQQTFTELPITDFANCRSGW